MLTSILAKPHFKNRMWANPAVRHKEVTGRPSAEPHTRAHTHSHTHTHCYLLVWWTVSSKTKLWECNFMVCIQTPQTVDHLFNQVICWSGLVVLFIGGGYYAPWKAPTYLRHFPRKDILMFRVNGNGKSPQAADWIDAWSHKSLMGARTAGSWKMVPIITLSTHKPGSKTNKL